MIRTTTSDDNTKLRRLAPFQNLFYLDRLISKGIEQTGLAEDRRKRAGFSPGK